MIEIRHHVPGRVRLKIPLLAETPNIGPELTRDLESLQGVQQVRANPACGSLVVNFQPGRVDPPLLQARVQGILTRQLAVREQHLGKVKAKSGAKAKAGAEPKWKRLWLKGRSRMSRQDGRRTPMPVCKLNARMVRWMFRSSLRYWWHDLLAVGHRRQRAESA
ncbi:hypothetical protein F2Q65_03955 [Thiohalocapsa marina]|uniref:Cation transporter n=1 Tax=Thiohalocapsa marina TaxID=424902 RepID=A0A5M8FTB8_9GAMM|nr:hypothetical protein [Thiohalocapsa marina]KAA6187045.1 hypothetical protein F2Q65_03955 [Thiohalocapsa marina]